MRRLEESQYEAVRCVLEQEMMRPVVRGGVTSEENRPEFVVQPFNTNYIPILAREPKVYKIAQRMSSSSVRARMSHLLRKKNMYTEFVNAEN